MVFPTQQLNTNSVFQTGARNANQVINPNLFTNAVRSSSQVSQTSQAPMSQNAILDQLLQALIRLLTSNGSTSPATTNETPPEPRSPRVVNLEFVENMYRTVLEREGELGGLNHWFSNLSNETLSEEEVVKGFFLSEEFQDRFGDAPAEEVITKLYQVILGREPEPEGLAGWSRALEDGMPLNDIIDRFFDSPEFAEVVGGSIRDHGNGVILPTEQYQADERANDAAAVTQAEQADEIPEQTELTTPLEAAFIEWTPEEKEAHDQALRLYDIILKRAPNTEDLDGLKQRLLHGETPQVILRDFITSAEYLEQGHSPEDTVTHLYNAILGRNPESEEAIRYWADQIRARGTEAVLNEILLSEEFVNGLNGALPL